MDTDTEVWPGRDADPGGGAKDVCFGPALGPKASGNAATSPALCGPSCYPVRAPDDESAGRGRAGAVACPERPGPRPVVGRGRPTTSRVSSRALAGRRSSVRLEHG